MKKIKALIVSIFLSSIILFIFFIIYNKNMDKKVEKFNVQNNSIRYSISYEKYKSHDAIVKNIDKDTILLMGSSELTATSEFKEHFKYFLNYKDKNIMQIGGAYFQSLLHSIILGSIEKDSKIDTVNFIVSMQWFNKEGTNDDAFLYRFSIDHLYNFYKNEKISKELKNKIYDRILELSHKNDLVTNFVGRIKRDNYFDRMINSVYAYKYRNIYNDKFIEEYKKNDLDDSINDKHFNSDINWEEFEKNAIERSKQESTNNSFYINNQWFSDYVGDKLDGFKDSEKNTTFSSSPEYSDLQLFIDVTKELGLKLNLIMVPLQGYWADYTGVSRNEIETYYNNIREISKKNDINLIDYSSFSYEPYFFKDVSHVGRLGLLRLQRDLLKYND